MAEGIFGVFALAIVELWAAIPLGFHLKLHPATLGMAAAAGSLTGAVVAMFFGDGLRRLFFWRKKETKSGRMSVWLSEKGPWAIGLLGPLLVGPTFAAGIAGAAGLPKAFSLALLAAGIVLWTVVLVLLGHYGIAWSG